MKKFVFLTLALLISTFIVAQETLDVVYLKNGSIIKGEIVKQENSDIIIKTIDGYLYSFKSIEIEQILKEYNKNLELYGGKFSSGIAIGGGGVFGLPMRFHRSDKFAFELGLFYRPGYFTADNYYSSSSYFVHSAVISLGPDFYFERHYKERKQKIISNGITIKGGIGFGEFNTGSIAIGWIHESFKAANKKKSLTFELGPGLVFTDFNRNNLYYSNSILGIYWKVQWNWYKP